MQAPGATRFDVPAPVIFPNLDGLASGEKALFFSYNHAAGRWDVIGTGTATTNGTMITDPGVGIRAPGWHLVQVGTATEGQPCTDQLCVVWPCKEGDVIEVDLSGTVALSERPTSESNFRGLQMNSGQIALDASGNILSKNGRPFSETGVFYFVPRIQVGPHGQGPLQDFQGTFTADLVRATGTRDPKTGVIRITMARGFSWFPMAGTVGQGGISHFSD